MQHRRSPIAAAHPLFMVFLVGSGGCGDDSSISCEPIPCPSASPWSARVCACVPLSSDECSLSGVIEGRLADASAIDCGALTLSASSEQMTAARQCVLDALAANGPFRMTQEQQGIDSSVATGYVWDGRRPILELHYDGDPSGGSGSGPRVDQRPCDALAAEADCTPSPNQLCLRCEGSEESTVSCRGPASHPTQ